MASGSTGARSRSSSRTRRARAAAAAAAGWDGPRAAAHRAPRAGRPDALAPRPTAGCVRNPVRGRLPGDGPRCRPTASGCFPWAIVHGPPGSAVTPPRYVAIHGHFYQPPRENPWLERVEVQDSAAPYHDWNARVAAECYAPNTAARRVDGDNRILDVVNNFAAIAFDVGPTLLGWLEQARPDVYRAILDADRASVAARGHGNAIAQAYGHAILPLCTRRDKVTEVRWGLADFRHRFGREAEGMWLPETAVDRETLEVLADEGVRFTLLAPGQAEATREPGEPWRPAAAGLDPRRAYRWAPGAGRPLALFFYDGPVSHAVAFEGLLGSGDAFAARLLGAFGGRAGPQLVHIATDGESYGHHHRFGEMALAAACARIETSGAAILT